MMLALLDLHHAPAMSTWVDLIGAEAQIVASELYFAWQLSPVSAGCARGALVRDMAAVACLCCLGASARLVPIVPDVIVMAVGYTRSVNMRSVRATGAGAGPIRMGVSF